MNFYKVSAYWLMAGLAVLCIILTALLFTRKLPLNSQANKNNMQKEIIHTNSAPAPIGPYSQAVRVGNTVYLSGQVCIDPGTGVLKNGDVSEETEQVMKNLQAVLQQAGLDFSHVVKTTIFLTDMNRFAEVNTVYAKYFTSEFPARETVQVSALPKFVNVEISMIALAP
jgi:2-iminobutanoate/2-iminopropanoate deaminase